MRHGPAGLRDTDQQVLELVDLIYRAAGDPQIWPLVLERLSEALGGNVGTIHHQDTSSKDSNFSALWNVGLETIAPYVEYYGALNPLMTTRPQLIRTGAVNTSQMLCPDEVYFRSEYYEDYLRPLGLGAGIAATLRHEGANSSNLSIFRPPGAEPFGEEERKLLLTLAPHLQRAFQLHTRIQGLERKGAAATEALDHLAQGIVLLDAKGQALFVNQAAAALFSANNGLTLTPRGLLATIAAENRRLNAMVQGATAAGNGKGLHSGGAMTISRRDQRQPLQILVTPLRTKTIHLGRDAPVAAVFISDPDRQPGADGALFAELYGFTPAEARLARILAAGETLKRAAEKLEVAESTVRSQLKSIFLKTNTNRQSDLVRILLAIHSSMRAPTPAGGNKTPS